MENEGCRAYHVSRELVKWHRERRPRNLPWKETTDPYKIWISEIMSQQTKLENILTYYERFVEAFPTVKDMAASDEDSILAMWSGLGYYTRARNLYKTACILAEKYHGTFPHDYAEIRALPGIGDYTAAAICSFAFGLAYPVIDTNVERLYARFQADGGDLKRKLGRKRVSQFLYKALDGIDVAEFNQAIMDFGADVCKPRNPECAICPLQSRCMAYRNGTVDMYPFKRQKRKKTTRKFHYLILESDGKIYLRKRGDKDIWRNLWEFPQIENMRSRNLLGRLIEKYLPIGESEYIVKESPRVYSQVLSHQKILAQFYHVELLEARVEDAEIVAISLNKIDEKAFPGIIRKYLKEEHGILL